MAITAERFHDISVGHRVFGQGGKCEHLHGHNYRIHFTLASDDGFTPTDDVGRVLDFSVIKERLCQWLEEHWDHRFLIWENDPWRVQLADLDPRGVVWTAFNPTAENMAEYLVLVVGPIRLEGTGCTLVACKVEETRKCSASYHLDEF